jgi:hypothetical protein
MVTSAVLETLNSLLSAGEVPGLYTHEELESLLAPLRELSAEDGRYRTVYDFFVSRVKRYVMDTHRMIWSLLQKVDDMVVMMMMMMMMMMTTIWPGTCTWC